MFYTSNSQPESYLDFINVFFNNLKVGGNEKVYIKEISEFSSARPWLLIFVIPKDSLLDTKT